MNAFVEAARQHMRRWNQTLREAGADARKHFLPSRGELNKPPRYPGVSRQADDDTPDVPEDDGGVIQQHCEACGADVPVRAPRGYEFREMDDAGDDDKAARWQCPECHAPNRLDGHRLRKISEAVATFRTAWREGDRVPSAQAQEPADAFRESYGRLDEPSLAGLPAVLRFDEVYGRR